MAAYTTIDNPELYFQTKLYAGNATEDTAITLDGNENMQPDLVWVKSRTDTRKHNLYDSVRGTNKRLVSSRTNAEDEPDDDQGVNAFNSDGFTVGTETDVNGSSRNFVAWCWKAGSAFSNDASATSIGDIDSSGSASTTAGFSICSYTGSGSAGDEIKHGLDKTPEMLIFKNRSTDVTWIVGSKPAGFTNIQFLQGTDVATDDSNAFNDTDPTSSVFTLGGNAGTGTNETGSSFICYAFTSIQGYSKIGSYKGGASNFPFIYLGFRPAFVLIKGAVSGDGDAAQNWELYDNKRAGYNGGNATLYPNATYAEGTNDRIHLMSNGFKININSDGVNDNNSTYIYMAFAEAPFVNSNGVPCNAR